MTRPNLSTDELAVLADLAPWAGRCGGLVRGDQGLWQHAIERLCAAGLVAVAREESPCAHTAWIATRAGLARLVAERPIDVCRALAVARPETRDPPERVRRSIVARGAQGVP